MNDQSVLINHGNGNEQDANIGQYNGQEHCCQQQHMMVASNAIVSIARPSNSMTNTLVVNSSKARIVLVKKRGGGGGSNGAVQAQQFHALYKSIPGATQPGPDPVVNGDGNV